MKSKLTKEEWNAIKSYQDEKNAQINRLFINHVEDDILFLLENEEQVLYTKQELVQNIELIKTMYTAIWKSFFANSTRKSCAVYKGTNVAEIEKLKINSSIHHFLIATSDKQQVEKELSSNWSRPVMIEIKVDETVPYLELEGGKILIAPFTKVKNLEENSNEVALKSYQVELDLQELENLSEEEQTNLYENILENVDEVNEKLKACVEFDHENSVHYENIRKLEQLLANHHFAMEQENYDQDTTESEKQSDLDDIARINLELNSLREMATKIFNIRKENSDLVTEWKSDIIVYLKNEFRRIYETYKAEENFDEAKEKEKVIEQVPEDLDPAIVPIKKEALENIATVENLLSNIKNLIAKQQNHARIAEAMDSNYKALNNAFEMKNHAEELDSLLRAISNKLDTISPQNTEELEKISETNLQVSTLLNYLNNAKAGVGKKITRFDEISIIEENELKKEIAETIKNIRCEAELKKLSDDIEIIEDKSNFRKFIGKFTGRNKLDETMLDQIHVRQTAIKKTFKMKMPLSYNYSIHELIAEIEMFIKENQDDELVVEDIEKLRKMKEVLKKNFVIIDSRVMSIMDQKTGKNLPVASRKVSKKELIEIDTYRFLNRYGYDKANDIKEPAYQDRKSVV